MTTAAAPADRRRPRVGDVRWHRPVVGRGEWRRWDGLHYVRSAYAARPELVQDPRELNDHPRVSSEMRRRLLDLSVDLEVRTRGARVVDRAERAVTLARPTPVSHVSHGVLTVLTGGLWGFAWVAMCLTRKEQVRHLQVDPWGNIWPVDPLFSVRTVPAEPLTRH